MAVLANAPESLFVVAVTLERSSLLDALDDKSTVVISRDRDGRRPGPVVVGVVGVDPGSGVGDRDRAAGFGAVGLREDLGRHGVAAAA